MELLLLLLLLMIMVTVLLLGISGMFLRLFDALVLTPKRIRSELGIQEIRESTPPSSLPANFQAPKQTQFKRKQVQRICFHQGKYRLCRGSIQIWPINMGTSDESYGI